MTFQIKENCKLHNKKNDENIEEKVQETVRLKIIDDV